jgi:hypothetical protein
MLLSCSLLTSPSSYAAAVTTQFKGNDVFKRILLKAEKSKWSALPIGDLMGKIALELEGTPYVANTLEISPDNEICSVNMAGLDCVTFFETTLDFARMLKKGGHTPAALLAEVKFTRYRGGSLGDYISRLHYTSDWFADNEQKGVVKVLVDLPGAAPFTQKVGFMTEHPESYRQLAAHPDLIPGLKVIEEKVNNLPRTFIPVDKLAEAEPLLKTGDIVGVCTSKPGIDITHTGLIYRDQQGVAHFMDASSKKSKMKVTLEAGPISKYLTWSKEITGAVFARPQEPVAQGR